MCPIVDQDVSHNLGDEAACAHCMSHTFYHTGPPSLCRSVTALMSYSLHHLVKWNLVGVNRLHLPEARGAENKLPLEVPRDREGHSTKEKNAVLML